MQCTKLKTYMETGRVVFLPASRIVPNPSQPRSIFENLEELASSIATHGILQPLSVRKTDTHFELIAGERRYRAAQLAGLRELPCIVMRMDEEESALTALMENLQRQDLNFVEEAKAYSRLMTQFSLSQEQVAKAVGKSQSAVSNTLRILRHSEAVLSKLLEQDLSHRHARALLKLNDEPQKLTAISHIARNHLSVTQTEQYIDSLLRPPSLPLMREVAARRTDGGRESLPQSFASQNPAPSSEGALSPQELLFNILHLLNSSHIPYSQKETPTHIILTIPLTPP